LSWSGRGLLEMDGTRSMTWTPDEQVASVTSAYTPPGTAMSLAGSEQRIYDGYGRVVRIVRNGEVLDRVYAGAEVIREVSSCGERAWWPSGDLDEPVAYSLRWEPSCTEAALGPAVYDLQLELVDLSRAGFASYETALTSTDGALFGVLQDPRADVVGVVDVSGVLLEAYDYDAYGTRRLRDPANPADDCASSITNACGSEYGNPRGYQGSFLSNVTGLYDMRARAYDPNLRIFLSPDPLGYVDGFDVWQYTAGDPLNLVDPFGFDGGQRDRGGSWTDNCGPTGCADLSGTM